MPGLVDEAAVEHFADLIDAVGELVAAIFDMDHRVLVRNVASVHIGDAAHECLAGGMVGGGRFEALASLFRATSVCDARRSVPCR